MTLTEIKQANKANGGTWFGKEEMAFFGSRIEQKTYLTPVGTLFVTSEQYNEEFPRRFSVRIARPKGSIRTLSSFQEFATTKIAHAWAKDWASKAQS